MNTSSKLLLAAALLIFSLAAPGLTASAWSQGKPTPPPSKVAPARASTLPTVTLRHWQKSSPEEKHAFLLGFISMMELEREWQGERPLPMSDSLVSSWGRGLGGLTVPQISRQLDDYILVTATPDMMDTSIVEAMWFKLVQPQITEKLSPEVKAKGRQLRGR